MAPFLCAGNSTVTLPTCPFVSGSSLPTPCCLGLGAVFRVIQNRREPGLGCEKQGFRSPIPITTLVILILVVFGHHFRNNNAGPQHKARGAYTERIAIPKPPHIRFSALWKLVPATGLGTPGGHWPGRAAVSGMGLGSPGHVGTSGNLVGWDGAGALPGKQDDQGSDHWLNSLQVMVGEAVRSKAKVKVSASMGGGGRD